MNQSINQVSPAKSLTIVFWNAHDSVRSATSIITVEGDPHPERWSIGDGQSIVEFFRDKMTVGQLRRRFGRYCAEKPGTRRCPKDWNDIVKQTLGQDQQTARKVALLVGLPVSVYEFSREINDREPRFVFRVEPDL